MASNGFGSNFLYESAKDVLKWNNLSVKENISDVMRIGSLLSIKDEDFAKINNHSNEEMSVNALNSLAIAMDGGKNGSNQN